MGSTLLTGRGIEDMHTAVREAAAERPVIGAFCPDEGLLLPAAHAIEALGLPGAGAAAVAVCRDKKLTRERLTAAGLPQPRHTTVSSAAELAVAAADLGYPVVLKPRALGASAGVVKVSGPDQVPEAYQVATAASYPGIEIYPDIVVEQYLDGPEISVDGAVFEGHYRPYAIAHKQIGAPPYFVETGHVVTGDDPLLDDPELLDILERAHKAVGFRHGMTHTELRLSRIGPAIVEINGRPGGDNIPQLALLAAGVDLGQIAASLAAGRPPEPAGRRSRTVGIRFLVPEHDCQLTELSLPNPADHEGLLETRALASPGDSLKIPPAQYSARYGYLIAEGTDAKTCSALLDHLAAAATTRTRTQA